LGLRNPGPNQWLAIEAIREKSLAPSQREQGVQTLGDSESFSFKGGDGVINAFSPIYIN
jgi:hypothetical protein